MTIVWLAPGADIKSAIEAAEAGQEIRLPPGDSVVDETIVVPDGVRIVGSPNTRLILAGDEISTEGRYVFDASGTTGSEISDIQFALSGRAGAVMAAGARDLTVARLTIEGDQIEATNASNEPPPPSILLTGCERVTVADNLIVNVRAGVYALDSRDIALTGNILDNVYFGQFAISGSGFRITGNTTNEAGQTNAALIGQGDGVTLFGADDVLIADNAFLNGKCYGVSFAAGINRNVTIDGNLFRNGNTGAIYAYVAVEDVTVSGNHFDANAGGGIGLSAAARNIVIVDNSFTGDGIGLDIPAAGLSITGNAGLGEIVPQPPSPFTVWREAPIVLIGIEPDSVVVTPGAGSSVDPAMIGALPGAAGQPFIQTSTIRLPIGGELDLASILNLPLGALALQVLDGDRRTDTAGVVEIPLPVGDPTLWPLLPTILLTAASTYDVDTFYVRLLTLNGWSDWGAITVESYLPADGEIILHVDETNDLVDAPEGSDAAIVSTASWYVLPDRIDRLALVGPAWAGLGNASANIITGNAADNYLAGDDGADVLVGEGGSDQIYGEAGADLLEGGDGGDLLDGGGEDDTLIGGDGDDFLTGGSGADRMVGGQGDDNYGLDDSADEVVEAAGEGWDRVVASVDATFAETSEIEVILLLDAAEAVTGTLTDNQIVGNERDNVLRGLGGNDWLLGGDGADTLIGGDGIDSLQGGTAGDRLDGDAGADTLSGESGADELAGGDGDDFLDGGADADRMAGGLGDDIYVVDDVADLVEEAEGGGWDRVFASSDIDLAVDAEVEIVVLTGGATRAVGSRTANHIVGNVTDSMLSGGNGDDRLQGLDGADRLFGDAGDDLLEGGAGADLLDGGAGRDHLLGGAGDDVYVVDSADDRVEELAGEGYDRLFSSADVVLTETAEVEVVILTGAGARASGSAARNHIVGSDMANILSGLGGDDRLQGLGGDDLLEGGLGADRLEGDGGDDELFGDSGNDGLTGGDGTDRLFGGGGDDWLDGGRGADLLDGGDGDDVLAIDAGDQVVELVGQGFDRAFVTADYVFDDAAEVEAIILTGAARAVTGSSVRNRMIGNDGAGDVLDGRAGDDWLEGRGGDDDLQGGGGADLLDGGPGNDVLRGGDDVDELFGGDGDDHLLGGSGGDSLDGGAGLNILDGGDGDDIYAVRASTDMVVESATGGWDRVFASADLALTPDAAVEVLVLTAAAYRAAGSDSDNQLVGTDLANLLMGQAGNDLLQGRGGDDLLHGGSGGDIVDGGDGFDTAVFSGRFENHRIEVLDGGLHVTDIRDGGGSDLLQQTERLSFDDRVVGLGAAVAIELSDGAFDAGPASRATFDWDGDGVADQTLWVGAGVGLLVHDRNSNGALDGAAELRIAGSAIGARSNLDALRAFDSDLNGLFDAEDADWASFLVWRDQDLNGVADDGELLGLAAAGFSAIVLGIAGQSSILTPDRPLLLSSGSARTSTDGTLRVHDLLLTFESSAPISPLEVELKGLAAGASFHFA